MRRRCHDVEVFRDVRHQDNALWDTQMISYAIKGWGVPHEASLMISSVTAQELLNMQRPDSGVRYGLPPSMITRRSAGNSTRRATGSGLRALAADVRNQSAVSGALYRRILLQDSMNVMLPGGVRVVESLHKGVSQVVNEGRHDVLAVWLKGEEKSKGRAIRARFDWLVDEGVQCLPLTPAACSMAEDLFADFVRTRTPKDDRRNTLNDLLILGHAMTCNVSLITVDKVLGEFAADRLDADAQSVSDDRIRITPRASISSPRVRRKDRRGSRSTQRHRMHR